MKTIIVCFLVAGVIFSGCGQKSQVTETVISEYGIPTYPNAIRDQSGVAKGFDNITRMYTTDSFETVMRFYTDKLTPFNPKSVSRPSKSGRQTMFTVTKEKITLNITLQEMNKTNKIYIIYTKIDF